MLIGTIILALGEGDDIHDVIKYFPQS